MADGGYSKGAGSTGAGTATVAPATQATAAHAPVAATEAVESRLLLDVVVRERAPILELLAREHEALPQAADALAPEVAPATAAPALGPAAAAAAAVRLLQAEPIAFCRQSGYDRGLLISRNHASAIRLNSFAYIFVHQVLALSHFSSKPPSFGDHRARLF